ncbi:hypothetical protein AMECASPLE_029121 [Ameca splendens]|uniref:protein-tyrosine-phosphatase n=1 Tax=Ameca splendens TaxID=208324 RepID=A0ABV0Z3I1_9TELE
MEQQIQGCRQSSDELISLPLPPTITQEHDSKQRLSSDPERTSHLHLSQSCSFHCLCDSVSFVLQLNSERRPVRHYWFSSWPDHHIPQCIVSLLKLVEEVEMYRKSLQPSISSPPNADTVPGSGPIIVHCSAGIGRTGCFIASSIGCQQLRETGHVDILETVCQLRLDRGGMIQTTEQYQFLYSTLAQYSRQLQQNQDQNQTTTVTQNQQNPEDQVIVQLENVRLQNN